MAGFPRNETVIEKGPVRASFDPLGGAVDVSFLHDGSWTEVTYRHPWESGAVPGLEGHLHGDFLCVPFGAADPGGDPAEQVQHGYACDAPWRVDDVATDRLTGHVDYPPGSAIASCAREIVCTGAGVEITDTVIAGRGTELPIGLHPILALPAESGAARLELPGSRAVVTAPYRVDERSLLGDALEIDDLTAIEDLDGGSWDLTRLPLDADVEELVQLVDVAEGRVVLRDTATGLGTQLSWDAGILPHCVLWISNRGRQAEPWSGRNLALGVEPVRAAFDLGTTASTGENPLSAMGASTAIALGPGEPLIIRHGLAPTPQPEEVDA